MEGEPAPAGSDAAGDGKGPSAEGGALTGAIQSRSSSGT